MKRNQLHYRKKLIEVDLPLEEINRAALAEPPGSPGHPWTLHKWFARRLLAACRAVIFSSMVDDPSSCSDEFPSIEEQEVERARLLALVSKLAIWGNASDEALIDEARYEIARSVARSICEAPPHRGKPADVLRFLNDHTAPVYDPFAGGGCIPIEVQRLGLRTVGSDLNPVSVIINKALIEIPPRFSDQPPINPEADPMGFHASESGKGGNKDGEASEPWRGAAGLTSDIRFYGKWVRERAFERIGHLYPRVEMPDGKEATVAAWLWARTIPCRNPVCRIEIPLVKSFQVGTRANNRRWIEPVVDAESSAVSFEVKSDPDGVPENGTVSRSGSVVTCFKCGSTAPLQYVAEQANADNMGRVMTAIVAEGKNRRHFISPNQEHIASALGAVPAWLPTGSLPDRALGFRVQRYGFTQWHQLFSARQLAALTTFCDLIPEAHDLMRQHGATSEYADAVCTYLAVAVSRSAEGNCGFNRWDKSGNRPMGLYSRPALPMVWDSAEANIFSNSAKNWNAMLEGVAKVIDKLPASRNAGEAYLADASTAVYANAGPIVVTDPPYYDTMAYADLSDFFYVWLRPILSNIYGDLFRTIATPKSEEMIAEPHRFDNSHERFEKLLKQTLRLIRENSSLEFPSSIFYAYKQKEERRKNGTSTGWETMLSALVSSGFMIVGTWPMLTEKPSRQRALGSNALSTTMILVCRPRADDAPTATRRQFLSELQQVLPAALEQLEREAHIAPVDVPQAAIGPGMQVYSKYSQVVRPNGQPVSVKDALTAIGNVVSSYHEQAEVDLEPESRFCLEWMKSYGFSDGNYGQAIGLARATNLSSVEALEHRSRLLKASGGHVRLLAVDEYNDRRKGVETTTWGSCLRMAYHMQPGEDRRGVEGAAEIAATMKSDVEAVERLARLLYDHYFELQDHSNTVVFNNLVMSLTDIRSRADEMANIEHQRRLI